MRNTGKSFGRRLPACVALLMMIVVLAQTSVAFTPMVPIYTLTRYYDISGNLVNLYQNPWDVSLTADQTTVKVGNPVKLTATVIYNGTAQKNVMVAFDVASGSYSWSDTKFTDASGKASAAITVPGAGAYRVNATARMQEGTGFKVLDSAYLIVNVQNKPIAVEAVASPESVSVNADSDITVAVKDFAAGTPVSGATVSLTKSGGRLVPASGTTGADGRLSATFTPDAAGAYVINVSVAAGGYDVWQGVVEVQGSDRPLAAAIEVSPRPGAPGSEVTVRVTASGDEGPVSNAAVNLTATGGAITPVSVKTGPDGVYTARFTAGQPGNYTLTAVVTADGYVSAAKSAEIQISKADDPLMLIVIGAVILIIVLIVLLFLLLRWLKSDLKVVPKKTKIPADGTSKVPIRVQFVNGFGMAKKMGRDAEVEIETTAGTIRSVVVPSGKEYADAELTSAKEFGPVEITAKANGKRATARVEFTLENGALNVSIQPSEIPADGRSSAGVTVMIKDGQGNVVAPLQDTMVDLKTTLGTLPGQVKLPARAPSTSISLVSGEVSGTAVVTATTEGMRGEGTVLLKGLPKRFCMHCGTAMSMEAAQCPTCGLTPPSGVDVKQCPTCGTVIPEVAKFCYQCGARQQQK
jgi:5-hydroxyisourate hydrolase-like protein (transthyretin family)/RNA polymerase subunit RPABC4/transcription elongation factor Spt4